MDMNLDSPLDETFARTAPARRPHSLRRTTSIEMAWPDGFDGSMVIVGQGRDLLTTGSRGETRVIAHDRLDMLVDPAKTVLEISADPPLAGIETLRGGSAVGGFRRAIAPLVDLPAVRNRPVAVLLDDVVGSIVMSGWLASKWEPPTTHAVDRSSQENVCSGYATGSKALYDRSQIDVVRPVGPIEPGDDALAFHSLQPDCDRTIRRVRRIDLWQDGADLRIDAMFQDSGVVPGTCRAVLHEYRLLARAEHQADGLVLAEVTAVPGSLPYSECQSPQFAVQRLVGTPMAQLRRKVLAELRGPIGCTHLNDALRSLAEVDGLAGHLMQFT